MLYKELWNKGHVIGQSPPLGALHDFMAAEAMDLVPVMPERRVMRSYWAVWHENLAASRKVAAVVGFLEGEMRAGRDLFLPQRRQSRA